MGVDILLLNTAVADFRDQAFAFTDELVGPGGLAKCRTEHMPDYTQQQYKAWIDQGKATAATNRIPHHGFSSMMRFQVNVFVTSIKSKTVSPGNIKPTGPLAKIPNPRKIYIKANHFHLRECQPS